MNLIVCVKFVVRYSKVKKRVNMPEYTETNVPKIINI